MRSEDKLDIHHISFGANPEIETAMRVNFISNTWPTLVWFQGFVISFLSSSTGRWAGTTATLLPSNTTTVRGTSLTKQTPVLVASKMHFWKSHTPLGGIYSNVMHAALKRPTSCEAKKGEGNDFPLSNHAQRERERERETGEATLQVSGERNKYRGKQN